jgi:N-acetylneuraminate synthase
MGGEVVGKLDLDRRRVERIYDMHKVQIANRLVGDGEPCLFIAEIGINHNGDVELAKKLIAAASLAGAEVVKFQKRTVDVVYTAEELARPRESPFGMTNGDLKRGLEFGAVEYNALDRYCREQGILWTASCWDEASVDFIAGYSPPCYKIASACLTDAALLKYHRKLNKPIILSTGMSTIQEIDRAVDILGTDQLVLLHTTSTYPAKTGELNLRVIRLLKERYQVPVGYSGHETGLAPTVGAVALGACVIERHITLDRAMWGTDQAASVEPHGLARLIKDCRAIEFAMGDGRKVVYESEIPVKEKLRRREA